MLALFSILWITALILIITDGRSETSRWISLASFAGGCGAFSVVLNERNLIASKTIIGLFSSTAHHIVPYAILIYALSSSNYLKDKWAKSALKIKLLLFLLPFLMFIFFSPIDGYSPSFLFLSLWTVPYIFLANIILILDWLKANNESVKKNKLLNCVIISPITLFAALSNYIFRIFDYHDTWRLHIILIVFQFGLFLYFGINYGVLGVKIKFEKHQLDQTMKSISAGTAIISHTMKNEIAKIDMCAENIRIYSNNENSNVVEALDYIQESTKHMLDMFSRLNKQMSDIVLINDYNNLDKIINFAIEMVKPIITNKKMNIKKINNIDCELYCDEIHIKEVLINILKNSIEAIKNEGEIEIELYNSKNNVVISVKDNGIGIPKEDLDNVLNPFYTTKGKTLNFGIGLSYSYNVMEKHGGALEIQSKEGMGTKILLKFPADRVVLTEEIELEKSFYIKTLKYKRLI